MSERSQSAFMSHEGNEAADVDADIDSGFRRCYGCFRPHDRCFCDKIPRINNRTNVLILQHRRERFHPFNTARIVHRALTNSSLIADYTRDLAAIPLNFSNQAGLLYPGPDTIPLETLLPNERPRQLVIVDGTWHQAKTLVRDIPALGSLPRYALSPTSPGRYRIRREPTAEALSTLEATVSALQMLEPDTPGLDKLTSVFDSMIDAQLASSVSHDNWRKNTHRSGYGANIPRAIARDLNNLVVCYGESSQGGAGTSHHSKQLIYWVARRIGTGEQFTCAIDSGNSLSQTMLDHLRLTPDDFSAAATPHSFEHRWHSFLNDTDSLVVYHPGTIDLLRSVTSLAHPCHVLKAVNFTSHRGNLEEILTSEKIVANEQTAPGRAGQRLAMAIALVQHLHQLANRHEVGSP